MHLRYREINSRWFLPALTLFLLALQNPTPALAASASEIDRKVDKALQSLYETTPGAKSLAAEAKGILVFPKTVKLGFIAGGQFGYGALRIQGQTKSYYNIVAGSFGLQAGLQAFATVLMFMDDSALNFFDRSGGWEFGAAPSIVVLDKGLAGSITTTTMQKGVFAFILNQQGVMAGIGLEGTKITRIIPGP